VSTNSNSRRVGDDLNSAAAFHPPAQAPKLPPPLVCSSSSSPHRRQRSYTLIMSLLPRPGERAIDREAVAPTTEVRLLVSLRGDLPPPPESPTVGDSVPTAAIPAAI
jgi:hypothetical protein